jgi:hypothetical protein
MKGAKLLAACEPESGVSVCEIRLQLWGEVQKSS